MSVAVSIVTDMNISPNNRMFFSFSCNVGYFFCLFRTWSFTQTVPILLYRFPWWNFENLPLLESWYYQVAWTITKCFPAPYGLRGSVEKNFFVIKSNFSYYSARSFIRSPWSIVRRSLSFPLLRRSSTVLIQFWIIFWRKALHELLMVVMIRSFE